MIPSVNRSGERIRMMRKLFLKKYVLIPYPDQYNLEGAEEQE